MLKVYTNIFLIILLSTISVSLAYVNLNSYNAIKKSPKIYSGYPSLPINYVTKTNPVEEVYGTVTNLTKNDYEISFDLMYNDNPQKIEKIFINKGNTIEYISKIITDFDDSSYIQELVEEYGSKENIMHYLLNYPSSISNITDLFYEIKENDLIYIQYRFNSLNDPDNYIIRGIIYDSV